MMLRPSCISFGGFGATDRAVAEHEKDMCPYVIDVITMSVASGYMFYRERAQGVFAGYEVYSS